MSSGNLHTTVDASAATATLVSIVTISYNQGQFLRSCIASVLEQTYSHIEYIVIDAGSTDGSLEVLRSISDPRFIYISEPDDGPADGLNKGFNRAKGEILYYLNADDVLLPNAIAHIVEYMTSQPSIDVVVGNAYRIDIGGERSGIIYSSHWSLKSYAYGGVTIVQQATFFRREAYFRTTGFNITNRTCWDGELAVDLALTGSTFRYCDTELACFRIHPGSITGSGRMNQQYLADSASLRERVFGVKPQLVVGLISTWYRTIKHLRQPRRTFVRLAELALGSTPSSSSVKP
jgi:glycosyltransferase involved in cell wall biosynthesis